MKRLIFLLLFSTVGFSCIHTQLPDTKVWNASHLIKVRDKIKKNDETYLPAYDILLNKAERHLNTEFYSVMQKKHVSPTGNKHDYMSMAPYTWPNPNTPNGLPYITRDGERNPELNEYDRNPLGNMCTMVVDLSLAHFFSGKREYADKAAEQIRVWFLNPETKMNPHLSYAQFIPGVNEGKGRSYGIIDVYSFLEMLDAVALLQYANALGSEDIAALQSWFTEFLQWLTTNEMGLAEKNAQNNHSIAYDATCTRFALFVNDTLLLNTILSEFPEKRLYKQIQPDGRQPQELQRTLAFHYTLYNIDHMLDICQMAGKQGEILYHTRSDDGRSIGKAIEFIAPYLGKPQSEFPYQQIHSWDAVQNYLCWILKRASYFDNTKGYKDLFAENYIPNHSERNFLLYYDSDYPSKFTSIVEKNFDFASKQLQVAVTEVEKAKQLDNSGKVSPRTVSPDGSLFMVPSRDWTVGFFPGSLWYMYEYTNKDEWKQLAEKYTLPLEIEKMNTGTHDTGFKMYCSFGNWHRLNENQNCRDILLQSAKTLITRFKPNAGIMRSWDHNTDKWQCPVIVDNMMNLELLFWASKETNDPVYYDIAVSHAKKTIENHYREDYSSYHVVDYDTITGKVLKKNTHQGYADESAWTRGQAWGLYGFTMCYRETGDSLFLKQARAIADFIFTHKNLPEDLIPYWDFDAPDIPNEPRDASAATISASALYELCELDGLNAGKYKRWADTILKNLSHNYLSPTGDNRGFLLLHSTGAKPLNNSEVDVPISYADYYFLEALLRKQKLESNEKRL